MIIIENSIYSSIMYKYYKIINMHANFLLVVVFCSLSI